MRRPDVQGLRAVAVLLVVSFHAGLPVPGGFVGVDVFFVISGFVIAATLLRELGSTGTVRLSRFYSRRVKRLGPALALMIAVVALLGVLAGPVETQQLGATTGSFAALFSANAYLISVPVGYFDPAGSLNPFLHLWTLGVEEQFYLVFPGLLLLTWWAGRRVRQRPLVLCGIVVIGVGALSLALALRFAGSGAPLDQRLAFYSAPTRAWEFAAGVLVALAVPLLSRLPGAVAEILAAAGIAAIAVGAFSTGHNDGYPVVATLVPVLGTCAVLAAGAGRRSTVTARALGTRPATWIGDLSYSWYLWHWPLIVYASVLWPAARWTSLAPAAASLVPAWLSYRFVEDPVRLAPGVRGRKVLALSAVCVVVPLAVCTGIRALNDEIAKTPMLQAYARSQSDHLDVTSGCQSTPLVEQGGDCAWGANGRASRIVLLGDSNASHFSEPVAQAAQRAGYELRIATRPYCPFVDVDVVRESRRLDADDCRSSYERNLASLLESKPNLVIVAARTDAYLRSRAFELDDPQRRALASTPSSKKRVWEKGLRSTLTDLNENGIPVVVVHPVPELRYSLNDCAVIRILTRSCAPSVSRASVERQLRDAIEVEDGAADAHVESTTLDTQSDLCDESVCRGIEGDVLLYRDSTHLSVEAADVLTDTFYDTIVEHARASP